MGPWAAIVYSYCVHPFPTYYLTMQWLLSFAHCPTNTVSRLFHPCTVQKLPSTSRDPLPTTLVQGLQQRDDLRQRRVLLAPHRKLRDVRHVLARHLVLRERRVQPEVVHQPIARDTTPISTSSTRVGVQRGHSLLDVGRELADVALERAGRRRAEVEESAGEPLLVFWRRELGLERNDGRERETLRAHT